MAELASAVPTASAAATSPGPAKRRRVSPDRLTVALLSTTAFLLVLALLGSQLGSASRARVARRAIVIHRIYRTTVLERVLPGTSGARGASSVTQSSSPPPVESASAAPVTRVS
jgi:hypothetical protein